MNTLQLCWPRPKRLSAVHTSVYETPTLASLLMKGKKRETSREHHDPSVCLYPTVHIQEMLRDNVSQLGAPRPLKRPFEHKKTGIRGGRFQRWRKSQTPSTVSECGASYTQLSQSGWFCGSRQPQKSRQCSSISIPFWHLHEGEIRHTLSVIVCVFVFWASHKLANIQLIILWSKLAVLTAYQSV